MFDKPKFIVFYPAVKTLTNRTVRSAGLSQTIIPTNHTVCQHPSRAQRLTSNKYS